MKKRFWSLILTLVMVLTLIPATTYVASDDGQLMLRWPWDWNNGPIEEVNGDKNQLMNEFNGCPGNGNSLFFYYVENGVETRVTADQLTSSNTNVVRVLKDEQNGDATRLEVVSFGDNVTIDYEKDGKTYSLVVNVILPDVGMYSAPTASKNTYLTSFTVTDTEKTFYVVPRAGYELDKVEALDGLQDIATVAIDASKAYATVTVYRIVARLEQ